MKEFVKTLDFQGGCFKYISYTFPGLSEEKLGSSMDLKSDS